MIEYVGGPLDGMKVINPQLEDSLYFEMLAQGRNLEAAKLKKNMERQPICPWS